MEMLRSVRRVLLVPAAEFARAGACPPCTGSYVPKQLTSRAKPRVVSVTALIAVLEWRSLGCRGRRGGRAAPSGSAQGLPAGGDAPGSAGSAGSMGSLSPRRPGVPPVQGSLGCRRCRAAFAPPHAFRGEAPRVGAMLWSPRVRPPGPQRSRGAAALPGAGFGALALGSFLETSCSATARGVSAPVIF